MADESSPEGATGRARGRARGRPTGPAPTELAASGDTEGGNGGGNGAGTRGRAGYRRVDNLRTIPENVKVTRGEGGTVVRIASNFFKLQTCKDLVIHDYHVEFEPTIETPRMRRQLLMVHREAFSNAFVFDGMANIKTINLVADLVDGKRELISTRQTDNEQIHITIKHVGEISWGHPEMMRMYNTQMRRNLQYLKYILIGRHFFDPTIRHKISSHKLEVWQGVITAINQHDSKDILMVCDTAFRVVRSDTAYDNLQQILNKGRDTFQDNARRELSGAIVMTSYNNKTYRIEDIDFAKTPSYSFPRRQGGDVTIKDYYKEQYNVTIRDQRQPLLVGIPSGTLARAQQQERTILLVPELCQMTGLTESLRNDLEIKKQMTRMTQADPNQRVHNLQKFINSVNNNPDVQRDMGAWKLKFDTGLVEVQGRRLNGEKILMKGCTPQTSIPFVQKSGDFGKEIRGKGMFGSVKIENWAIICTSKDRALVDDFSSTLNRVCRPMDIILSRPQVIAIVDDRTGTFVETCKKCPQSVQLVIILVPNNNKDRYDAIKKIFCIEHPLASQVVVTRTLSKKQMLMSVCTKIGIQMACKLGGEAWALDIPPKELMVVGFDVHRDTSTRGRAIGGFVCSTNSTLTKWYSRVAYHNGQEELSNNFTANFSNGLKRYHELNKKLPQRIVIYRDGVSEGELSHVYDIELKQIEDSLKKIGAAAEGIKLAFVVVTKRISARFFGKIGEKQYENPQPGTIIDNTVTREERYDFYLVSQSVRQGTVVPTMYNIIKDNTNWKPNHHQQLAYKLTHLYYNWQGTIRVPAPCQYAHKLAYLTGTALHREPNAALADTLFYL